MARLPRIVIPNQPMHIMHRGNNRQIIFETEDDMLRIKEDISHALIKSDCDLHAYVIMTNHLHLLITPKEKGTLAVFMQSMANRYVRYFNATRKKTGTIWEGRYKSCLIDSENHLFKLYKYIESNPVKAKMVDDISDYKWSSYRHNAYAKKDKLIKEHALYLALGTSTKKRSVRYRELFATLDIGGDRVKISKATRAGDVYGSSEFHAEVARLISRVTKRTTHGGDRKSKEYNEKAG